MTSEDTDRELLELAAKAAEYEVRRHEGWQCFVHVGPFNIDNPPTLAGQRITELEAAAAKSVWGSELAELGMDKKRLDFLSGLRTYVHSGDGYYSSKVEISWGDSIERRTLREAIDTATKQVEVRSISATPDGLV